MTGENLRALQIVPILAALLLLSTFSAKAKTYDECLAAIPPETENRSYLAFQCVAQPADRYEGAMSVEKQPEIQTESAPGKSADQCETDLRSKGKLYTRGDIAKCILDASGLSQKEPSRDQKIHITDYGIASVNSAGGVEPYIVFINPNQQSPVKYVNVTMQMYNAVGDRIKSDIGGRIDGNLRFTGPLSFNDGEARALTGIQFGTTRPPLAYR